MMYTMVFVIAVSIIAVFALVLDYYSFTKEELESQMDITIGEFYYLIIVCVSGLVGINTVLQADGIRTYFVRKRRKTF